MLAFCAVAFGGLGYLFVSLTDGINQTATTRAGAQTDVSNQIAPPSGPIVADDAPTVLGSKSITTNENHDEVVVDFFECAPGSGSIEFESGTVTLEMRGLQGNDCVVEYKAGENAVACSVPSGIGVKRFTIQDEVPNLGSIESYCEAS